MIWVLAVLACYRLTRLVTTDTITEPLRELVQHRGRVGYLVGCDWCVSVWVGVPVSALVVWAGGSRVVVFGFGVLALSALVGFGSIVEARLWPEEIPSDD